MYGIVTALVVSHVPRLASQTTDIDKDRADYATWLAAAPLSPYAAVALQPIGAGLVLGPAESDIPLSGVEPLKVTESRGALFLEQAGQRRALHRNTMVSAGGGYRLLASGPAGRTQLLVYGPPRQAEPPLFFTPAPAFSFVAPLEPPERRGVFRTLGFDGLETEATEAGFVTLTIAERPTRLRVYRMGSADDEEAELQIFFRDSTSGNGTYPAGRFLVLEPAGSGRYQVDFNRARNPFCAYNTVFPCPPPWPGNTVPQAIRAGERYEHKS